jgi:hypothetical protein
VVTQIEYVPQVIEKKEQPRGVRLNDVDWYVITPDNIEKFLSDFKDTTGDVVFLAISVPHYENLSLNVAELRRYIEQQRSIILYYENSINNLPNKKKQPEEQ